MNVSELMSKDVVTLEESDDMERALQLLGQRKIRHLPVVRAGVVVGLITQRDVLRVIDSGRRLEPDDVMAQDIMTRQVVTIAPDSPVGQAAQILLDRKFGCLPVVEGERLVGIITEADFVRLAREQMPSHPNA